MSRCASCKGPSQAGHAQCDECEQRYVMTADGNVRASSTIDITRKDDGSIDYAAIGSQIEHAESIEAQLKFAAKFWQSTDAAMAELACYAIFCAKAREQRLRGNIELAEVAERNADSIYSRCIKPENRW